MRGTWNIETDSPLIMMFAIVEASRVLRMLRSKKKHLSLFYVIEYGLAATLIGQDQPEKVDEHEQEGEDAKA